MSEDYEAEARRLFGDMMTEDSPELVQTIAARLKQVREQQHAEAVRDDFEATDDPTPDAAARADYARRSRPGTGDSAVRHQALKDYISDTLNGGDGTGSAGQ